MLQRHFTAPVPNFKCSHDWRHTVQLYLYMEYYVTQKMEKAEQMQNFDMHGKRLLVSCVPYDCVPPIVALISCQ